MPNLTFPPACSIALGTAPNVKALLITSSPYLSPAHFIISIIAQNFHSRSLSVKVVGLIDQENTSHGLLDRFLGLGRGVPNVLLVTCGQDDVTAMGVSHPSVVDFGHAIFIHSIATASLVVLASLISELVEKFSILVGSVLAFGVETDAFVPGMDMVIIAVYAAWMMCQDTEN